MLCSKSVIDFDEIFVGFEYHNFFSGGNEKKITSINFPEGRKNWKMAIFGIHYIKVISFFMPMKWTCKIFMNSQLAILMAWKCLELLEKCYCIAQYQRQMVDMSNVGQQSY